MTREKLEAILQEHMSLIETLPPNRREDLVQLVRETRERHASIQQGTARAREALDDWRLVLKYLVFDKEARQREFRDGDASNGDCS